MKTFNFQVVGISHKQTQFSTAQVKRGDRLTLTLEPQNTYDARAVAVLKDGVQIGYVPRSYNKDIHEAIKVRPTDVDCCVETAWHAGCCVVVSIKDVSD